MAQKHVKSSYQHLFFDLDHTLWDFERNSQLALEKLFVVFGLEAKLGISIAAFIAEYKKQNAQLWEAYHRHQVTKTQLRQQRFSRTLARWNYTDPGLALLLDEAYLEEAPRNPHLIAGARELLEYLQPRYQLHIITNGFKDATALKLQHSRIHGYFAQVITSDEMGINKPAARIFMEALKRAGATRKNAAMIGDNLSTDMAGAKNCGIDQVYYNPQRKRHTSKITYEVTSLIDIATFL